MELNQIRKLTIECCGNWGLNHVDRLLKLLKSSVKIKYMIVNWSGSPLTSMIRAHIHRISKQAKSYVRSSEVAV